MRCNGCFDWLKNYVRKTEIKYVCKPKKKYVRNTEKNLYAKLKNYVCKTKIKYVYNTKNKKCMQN